MRTDGSLNNRSINWKGPPRAPSSSSSPQSPRPPIVVGYLTRAAVFFFFKSGIKNEEEEEGVGMYSLWMLVERCVTHPAALSKLSCRLEMGSSARVWLSVVVGAATHAIWFSSCHFFFFFSSIRYAAPSRTAHTCSALCFTSLLLLLL